MEIILLLGMLKFAFLLVVLNVMQRCTFRRHSKTGLLSAFVVIVVLVISIQIGQEKEPGYTESPRESGCFCNNHLSISSIKFVSYTQEKKVLKGYLKKEKTEQTILEAALTRSANFSKGTEAFRQLKEAGIAVHESSQTGYLNISAGNLVVCPRKKLVVASNDVSVHLKKGCSVFLSKENNNFAVLNLNENWPGGVRVLANKYLITVAPGHMLFFSEIDSDTKSENAVHHSCLCINHEEMQCKKLTNNLVAYGTEFSIESAIKHIEPLKEMMKSKKRWQRRLINRLLLNAVLLNEYKRELKEV